MNAPLQIGPHTVTTERLVAVLATCRLLPQVVRELTIDRAIAEIACTPDEQAQALREFCERQNLLDPARRRSWLAAHLLDEATLRALALRELRIEKFKQATFAGQVESYFLKRKPDLDQVVYSLLRTRDGNTARELFFRLQEGEQTWADLARQFSEGPEAQTGGLIGPVELSTPHPALAGPLRSGQPGRVWPPMRIGEWFVLIRLEQYLPARLDEAMRRRLVDELFSAWLAAQSATPASPLSPAGSP